MPKISISNKKLKYGIDVKEMFWVKHDIITEIEIRRSKDEEALAQIYGYMILGKDCGVNSGTLDSFLQCKKEITILNFRKTLFNQMAVIFGFHSFFEIYEELQKNT